MPVSKKMIIRRALLIQLDALKQLSKRLFTPPNKFTQQHIEFVKSFSIILSNKNADPINLAGAVGGLDMLIPEWRTVIPKNILSRTVRRDSKEVRQWTKNCLQRDNHACVKCGSNSSLSVHHICTWAEFPELTIDEDNGTTLCGDCHSKEHPEMGIALFVKN